ncbi:MAG: TonB-dependent receptor [Candidatus Aquilonibacter sp.]
MHKLVRSFIAAALVAAVVQPVYAATTASPELVSQAMSATTGAISGTVKDGGGAPVAGATITLQGVKTLQTTSDATGAFQISAVPPGLYIINVAKPGFETATESDFTVFSGEVEKIAITLPIATFTSLRTIASVRATAQSQFNTSTASLNVITAQDFADQAQPQVGRVLNQIPGLQNTLPTSSANGSVPGAITVPNIRGGLSFETASLIDGHPLAVGDYGDYVTTFLSSYMLGSVEVVKGPGAMSPQTNYAIGGTVNFRTKDPTATLTPDYTIGVTNRGGTFYNFGISDTIGRLGFVLDLAGVDDLPALHNYSSYFNPNNSFYANGTGLGYTDNLGWIGNTNSKTYNNYSLVACCYTYDGAYDGTYELAKLRYKFSNATTATVSYLGGQTWADQNANTSELVPSVFQPGAGYDGSLPVGAQILGPYSLYPQTAQEINNEPIFQAEIRSLIGNDTVLARYYHASINRLIYEGNPNPAVPVQETYSLYGTAGSQVFNGESVPVDIYDWYNQFEEDRLSGLSFEYEHPFGDGDDVTFSVDQNRASSVAGSWGTVSGSAGDVGTPSITNPAGTNQTFTTFLLRSQYNFTPKLSGTVALYDNLYQNTFPYALNGTANAAGTGYSFTTSNSAHFDERMALEYRPSSGIAIRASAGSAIAPPYLSLLSKLTTPPSTCSTSCAYSANNPNLVPETAFGYDLGADFRLPHDYGVVSIDGYLTDLYNHFLAETVAAGTCAAITYPGLPPCPAGVGGAIPVYVSLNTNLNNSRFEGIELSWKRGSTPGKFGWNISGAIQHAYAYDLPAGFYCQNLPAGEPCVPATYNVNLPIIAGANFTGNAFGTTYNGAGSVGASGFSNTAIPYFQGNATVNYTLKDGIYLELGETLYGKNNGYNLPPFGIGYATIRVPLNNSISFQVSGDNIFNAWPGLFPIVGGGIAYPLANGTLGATIGNTVGPATYRFMLTKTFGAGGVAPGAGQ